jgi:hypothetical protein
VTPLANAEGTNERLGNNARLVQQVNGWGHATLSQISFCTALITQAYWVNGTVPSAKHTNCTIDEQPFVPFNLTSITQLQRREGVPHNTDELSAAWAALAERWSMIMPKRR